MKKAIRLRLHVVIGILFLPIGFDVGLFGLLLASVIGLAIGMSNESFKDGLTYGLACCLGVGIGSLSKYFILLTHFPVRWWYLWVLLAVAGILLLIEWKKGNHK